jgi:hypothetical protein
MDDNTPENALVSPSWKWQLQVHTSASVCPQAKDVNALRIRCNMVVSTNPISHPHHANPGANVVSG